MSAGGIYEIIPESLMSAVSALSGSGVAFVSTKFLFPKYQDIFYFDVLHI